MTISHAGHNHPATPAGRAACRRKAEIAKPVASAPDYIAQHIRATAAKHAIKARMDRDYDTVNTPGPRARVNRPLARIQPKRSGARVSARDSSCVQAALHIDAHGGRCACGWVADKAA